MKIYMKTNSEIFNESSFIKYSNKDLDIVLFDDISVVPYGSNILCLNREFPSLLADDSIFYNCLIYENELEKAHKNIDDEIKNHYDYNYLKRALSRASEIKKLETIFTGSSYGLFAINEEMLENEMNFSLMSQDIYYSDKLVRKVTKSNLYIQNIVVFCSYYYLHSDLSKTQNLSELSRISKVYQPLLMDIHNASFIPQDSSKIGTSFIFDIEKMLKDKQQLPIYDHYFNTEMKRENRATKLWTDKNMGWADLSEEEKNEAGKKRAENHNSSIKHSLSLIENTAILDRLSEFCFNNKIKLNIVISPSTEYYQKYFDKNYKSLFYNSINKINHKPEIIDLFSGVFDDSYFNDTDHLNDEGAKKLTAYILEKTRIKK